ncbi:MAG: hypothetical protein ACREBC_28870, partial [Pyrinomonadaceae bacterium]
MSPVSGNQTEHTTNQQKAEAVKVVVGPLFWLAGCDVVEEQVPEGAYGALELELSTPVRTQRTRVAICSASTDQLETLAADYDKVVVLGELPADFHSQKVMSIRQLVLSILRPARFT